MKKTGLISILIGLGVINAYSQDSIVSIPDTAFLYALIDVGVDTNVDSLISYGEAWSLDMLDVNGRGISNLTGIEAFVNLVSLDCSGNNISTLDASFNIALEILDCQSNQLASLNIAGCNNLKSLNCGSDYIRSGNQLTSLDVSNNTALEFLNCAGNQLTSLDITNLDSLRKLGCADNLLSHLDASNNQKLDWLSAGNNLLTSLDLSGNLLLKQLYLGGNLLTTLDISGNTTLEILDIQSISTLYEVCVWKTPFPPEEVVVYTLESSNVYFADCVAPYIAAPDTVNHLDYIEVTSSEDGIIYLVPDVTEKDLAVIRGVCTDSVPAIAASPVEVSLSSMENGRYWLYAADNSGNISEPRAFSLVGVGIEQEAANEIRIYPNPTYTFLTIEIVTTGMMNIEITSLNSQLLLSKEIEGTVHQFDLSSFQKGVYFITIRSKDFVTTRKIVKL